MRLPNIEQAISNRWGSLQGFVEIAGKAREAAALDGEFPGLRPGQVDRWVIKVIRIRQDGSLEMQTHTQSDQADGTVIRGESYRFHCTLSADGTPHFEPLSITLSPRQTISSPKDHLEELAASFDSSIVL